MSVGLVCPPSPINGRTDFLFQSPASFDSQILAFFRGDRPEVVVGEGGGQLTLRSTTEEFPGGTVG